jgi:hypothetical protein
MNGARWGFLLVGLVLLPACNEQRKQECDRFLDAVKPLDQGPPTQAVVDSVAKQVAGIHFQDAPLGIYAKNYGERLTILSNTLGLKEGSSPPDGTDDVIKQNLAKARTDASDVRRYCAQ